MIIVSSVNFTVKLGLWKNAANCFKRRRWSLIRLLTFMFRGTPCTFCTQLFFKWWRDTKQFQTHLFEVCLLDSRGRILLFYYFKFRSLGLQWVELFKTAEITSAINYAFVKYFKWEDKKQWAILDVFLKKGLFSAMYPNL